MIIAMQTLQSHTSTRVVGNVDFMDTGNCDCAWVDATTSVAAEIWKTSSSNYDVFGKKNDAFQLNGEFVYKVGANTGDTLGAIHVNSPWAGVVTSMVTTHGGGDSGATVFQKSGSSNAVIYGMMIGTGAGYALYQPHDYIEYQLSITTSTS